MRIVALSSSSHEETQLNRVCCFLILEVLSISEGSVFQIIWIESFHVLFLWDMVVSGRKKECWVDTLHL